MIDGFQVGPRSYNKLYQQHGGFASFAVAPGTAARAFPNEAWNFDQAATYAGAFETAYHIVYTYSVHIVYTTVLY